MVMKTTIRALSLVSVLMCAQVCAGEIVVIGNDNVPKMDAVTIGKIYTGKFVSVSGVYIMPVSFRQGSATRDLFLQEFLNQDEEKYTAYWTVRRYIGKGEPPIELNNATDIINFVQATPGAIGYIDEVALKPGLNVIARR